MMAGCASTGSYNTFFGQRAGSSTSGAHNIFFGSCSGRYTTTGAYNIFMGRETGYVNTAGRCNIFMGRSAGSNNATGCNNTFIGSFAGQNSTSGCYNMAFGASAGCSLISGSNNLFFGRNAGTSLSPSGLAAITTESNRIIMGNASHSCAQIQIAWTVVSDCRDKCIFGAVPHGRGFLQNLETIEYAFKDRETGCITDPEGKRRYGFTAQNVLAAEGDHPVVISTEDPEKLQLTSDYMIPILVNAVNELSTEVELLKARLDALEAN
jgi:hypothetical protein